MMDQKVLNSIAADAAYLAEAMARRGVPAADVPVIAAGAMPAIAEYEIDEHAAGH